MSTLSRDYEYGRIVSVDVVTLGDNLAADAAMSDATVTVEDAADFDEDGGSLLLNGVVYAYTACDDDTGIISGLDPVLAAAAVEGDDVSVYDPQYATVETDKVAQVAVVGDDGAVDMLECAIALHLIDALDEGVRGGKGESVKMELDGGEWVVVDIRGLGDPATGPGGGSKFKIDPFTVTAPGAQSLTLTYEPLAESHHLYWNGQEQEGAYTIAGQAAAIDSTEGADLVAGDDLVVKYAYRQGIITPAAGDSYFNTVIADSPTGFYRVNGNADDSSGHARHGIGVGAGYDLPGLVADSPGDGANPFSFVGFGGSGTNRIFVDDVASGGWPESIRTLECWARPATIAAGVRTAVSRDWSDGTSNVAMCLGMSGDKARAVVVLAPSTTVTVTGSTALAVGQDVDLMLTHDGSTLRLYVDGVLDGSAAASGTIKTASWAALRIGGRGAGTETWDGLIDEVSVYSAALTASQAATHHAAGLVA